MDISKESLDEIDDQTDLSNLKKIEAALFISGRFLNIQELVVLTYINPILLKKSLNDLDDKYKNSGIELVKRGESWKMDVSQEYAYMVNKLATGNSEFTKAEQETLAIIAYKQPIKQSVLIKIRGNKAYDHIKKFVELSLINKKKIGHTAELKLNDNFYEYFHLNSEEEIKKVE